MRLYSSLLLLSAFGVASSNKLTPPDWPKEDYADNDACWYDLPAAEGKHGLSCQHYEHTIGKGATECIFKAVAPIVTAYVNEDTHNAAHLLRLHFHDCFVNGCDASLLLKASSGQKSGSSEREAPPNLTVEGYEVMDRIKAAVDEQCDPDVSCADLLAIGSMIGVALVGGPLHGVPLGRLDGCVSQISAPPIHLPSAQALVKKAQGGAPQGLAANFKHVGLDTKDLVALSGAHTLGHVHCPNIQDRIGYANFRSPEPIDSTLKKQLYNCCVNNKPSGCEGKFPNKDILETPEVDLERGTPKQAKTYPPRGGDRLFDNSYFKNLVQKMGILTSDQALYSDDSTKGLVAKYANDEEAFFESWVVSMIRMGSILPSNMGVEPGADMPLCGNRGEPICLAYPKNSYGIRQGSCSNAARECANFVTAQVHDKGGKKPSKLELLLQEKKDKAAKAAKAAQEKKEQAARAQKEKQALLAKIAQDKKDKHLKAQQEAKDKAARAKQDKLDKANAKLKTHKASLLKKKVHKATAVVGKIKSKLHNVLAPKSSDKRKYTYIKSRHLEDKEGSDSEDSDSDDDESDDDSDDEEEL